MPVRAGSPLGEGVSRINAGQLWYNLRAAVQHNADKEKEKPWKQTVDQDEQPVPKVEEEEAPAAKLRSGAGTAT
jgi:hypothetical protein